MADGARAHELALLLGVGFTTLARAACWCRRWCGPGQGQPPPCGSAPERRRTPKDPAHLQQARIRGAATWADRACAGGSWPIQPLRAQLLPGAIGTRASPSAVASPATARAQTGSTPASRWAESGVELGYHLSPHQGPRNLAVPLPGDRRLEPLTWPHASVAEALSGGLGWRQTQGSRNCRRSGEQGLPARADQQRPKSATDPACR